MANRGSSEIIVLMQKAPDMQLNMEYTFRWFLKLTDPKRALEIDSDNFPSMVFRALNLNALCTHILAGR